MGQKQQQSSDHLHPSPLLCCLSYLVRFSESSPCTTPSYYQIKMVDHFYFAGVCSHFIEQLSGFCGLQSITPAFASCCSRGFGGDISSLPPASASRQLLIAACASRVGAAPLHAHLKGQISFLLPCHTEPSSAFTPTDNFLDKTSPKPFCEPGHTSAGLKRNPLCWEHFLPAPCDSDFTNYS